MEIDPKSAPTLAAPPGTTQQVPSSRDVRVDALVGTVVDGRYAVEKIIGEGGMGIVYRARHRLIEKRVAIKVLRKEMAQDREMTERFMQEARAASSIGNGHIVDVSDFGVMPDGAIYFVMEYLDGRSVTELVEAQTALPVSRAVRIAKQIARGLGAAHAAGIVHRDLKPDNVMLVTRGDDLDFVKILDFGIAKVGTQPTKITRAGSIFGTPHYMSPEQAAGTSVDARTDVYALGVILYEMVVGKVPFDAEGVMGILSQHLHKAPTPLIQAARRADVPASLEAVVMKCLAKSADDRYASMEALAEDLDAVERGLTPNAMFDAPRTTRTSFFEPATGTSGVALSAPGESAAPRRAWMIGVAGALGVAGIAAAITLLTKRDTFAHGATPIPSAVAATTVVPEEKPSAPPPELAPSVPAPASRKLLVLKLEPGDAHAFEGNDDLGTSPVLVWLKSGEQKTLTIKRAGYAPRTETFDADSLTSEETKASVKLAATARPPARSGTKPAADKAATTTITDHDPDPWKHKP